MRVRINDFLPREESPVAIWCHVAMPAVSAMRFIAFDAIIMMCLGVVRYSAR
jgi:hypothetical protein